MPSNPFYQRQTTLAPADLARASDLNAEFDALVSAFDSLNVTFNLAIGLPPTFAGNRTIPVQTYTNKIVYINALGNADLYEFENIVEYETAANNAAASAALAAAYAEEAEDVPVLPGVYSAKHWAAKAEQVLLNGALSVGYTPAGDLAATNVEDALNELDAEKASQAFADTLVVQTAPVISAAVTEDEYVGPSTGSVDILPANGSRQFFDLTGPITFTSYLATGQSLIVGVDNGVDEHEVTWPVGVIWLTDEGFAPYMNPVGYTFVALLRIRGALYGLRGGNN